MEKGTWTTWTYSCGTLGSRGCRVLLVHTPLGSRVLQGEGRRWPGSQVLTSTVRKCPRRHFCTTYCFSQTSFKGCVVLENLQRKNDRMFCFIHLAWWDRSLFRHFSWNSVRSVLHAVYSIFPLVMPEIFTGYVQKSYLFRFFPFFPSPKLGTSYQAFPVSFVWGSQDWIENHNICIKIF